MITGMGQAMSPLPVVGKEQQSQAVKIETPDRIHSLLDGFEEVCRKGSPGWIVDGANVSEGLVEHQVGSLGRGMDLASVNLDTVLPPDRFGPQFPDDPAVEHDPSGNDQFICLSS